MRQVDQRISVRCALDTLEQDALEGYLAHRLAVAGDGANRIEFSAEALGLLYQSSMGNPRVLNLIADKSLNRGHFERTWVISRGIVEAALDELGYARPASAPAPAVPQEIAEIAMWPEPLPALALAPIAALAPSPEPSALLEFTAEGTELPVMEAGAPPAVPVAGERKGTGRLRHAAMLAAIGMGLAAAGLGLNEWELRRQELAQPIAMPALPRPPQYSLSAPVAPVIPPADFFALNIP
jgi:hypothetical protein